MLLQIALVAFEHSIRSAGREVDDTPIAIVKLRDQLAASERDD